MKARTTRTSRRALIALVVARCGHAPQPLASLPSVLRPAALRFSTWLELVSGHGRVGHGGDAVLCLRPPRPSPRLLALGLLALVGPFVVLVALASMSLLLAVVLATVMLGGGLAVLVGVALTLGRSRAARSQLRRARPASGWYLHSFASARPGAGRALLDRVCAEADAAGRVLYLDTLSRKLIDYYEKSGFTPAVKVVVGRGPASEKVTRMARPVGGAPPTTATGPGA